MPNKYRVIRDENGVKAGTIVYDFMGCDYGCSNSDTRILGGGFDVYTPVTHDPSGKAPAFTMRERNLEPLPEPPKED